MKCVFTENTVNVTRREFLRTFRKVREKHLIVCVNIFIVDQKMCKAITNVALLKSQLKSCQLLHNYTKNEKVCNR